MILLQILGILLQILGILVLIIIALFLIVVFIAAIFEPKEETYKACFQINKGLYCDSCKNYDCQYK